VSRELSANSVFLKARLDESNSWAIRQGNHPLLRDVWQRYLAGELDEHQPTLTQEEVEALFNLIRTPAERQLVEKVVRMIQF